MTLLVIYLVIGAINMVLGSIYSEEQWESVYDWIDVQVLGYCMPSPNNDEWAHRAKWHWDMKLGQLFLWLPCTIGILIYWGIRKLISLKRS